MIFKAIVGSQSYGTSTPQSDIDYKGVYIQPISDIISLKYREQYEDGKDAAYYEVQRFLQLLQSANPTVLELLYSPEDCIVLQDPLWALITEHRQKFLTKKCRDSFGGYAIAQIKKARGLDKKMNWEKARVQRKRPIDFCYAYEKGKTMPIEKWLRDNDKKQECCGLVALNHFRDCYALYYDYGSHYNPTGHRAQKTLGFHGIIMEKSNDIRLSSVPKDMEPLCVIFYNKDGYSMHCKDYLEYETWLANRNTQRYVDLQGHNQQIDGKNLLHCRRLLDMALEIANDGVISVRRPNSEYLLKIRRGEIQLQEIIDQAEEDIKKLDEVFKVSGLPDSVDTGLIGDILLSIRSKNDKTFV